MPIMGTDPYRGITRISRERFANIIRQRANPAVAAERDPGQYWDKCREIGVDPLFVLSMFNHESSMGKAGVAITSKSWGNTRKPNFGATPIGETPGRTGVFPVWASWMDGLISTATRLVTDQWYYGYEQRNITTVFNDPVADNPNYRPAMAPVPRKVVNGKVQRIEWAPAGDLNNPAGYLRAMLDFMNANQDMDGGGGPPVATMDDPRFEWKEDKFEYGYPTQTSGRGGFTIELGIIHITVGTNSEGHLLGQNQSSTHYLTNRDGTPRQQHVRERDAAWTAGNREYNQRGINMEFENRPGDVITDEMMRNFADTCRPIFQRNNIPFVYLGRDNRPGKRGIIGHLDVPDPDGSGWGGAGNHTDPDANPTWDWAKFIRFLNEGAAPGPDPNARFFPETGYWIVNQAGAPAYAFWQERGGVEWCGYPLEGMRRYDDGVTRQLCENILIECPNGVCRQGGLGQRYLAVLSTSPEPPPVDVELYGVIAAHQREVITAAQRITELAETDLALVTAHEDG